MVRHIRKIRSDSMKSQVWRRWWGPKINLLLWVIPNDHRITHGQRAGATSCKHNEPNLLSTYKINPDLSHADPNPQQHHVQEAIQTCLLDGGRWIFLRAAAGFVKSSRQYYWNNRPSPQFFWTTIIQLNSIQWFFSKAVCLRLRVESFIGTERIGMAPGVQSANCTPPFVCHSMLYDCFTPKTIVHFSSRHMI